ncbi:hypothetical protein OG394_39605 [Kribbella sp. NBC_01245]|uniref:hypothetical protein n=1 Tax=Kribbella sp. NBC_01245 TaxID=2903578 RepID=UPI002E2A1B77|nr:hypothetical protein [Kribbella sp. NBC_01245]
MSAPAKTEATPDGPMSAPGRTEAGGPIGASGKAGTTASRPTSTPDNAAAKVAGSTSGPDDAGTEVGGSVGAVGRRGRRFVLDRLVDVSMVSGVGQVAEGVEFSDGSVALRWPGETPCTAVFPAIEAVIRVHGHGGMTVVRWLDPPASVAEDQQAATARGEAA